MNCHECQAWLQARLDGANGPAPDGVEAHCAECPTCREERAAAVRLLEGLRQLRRPRPAPGLAQELTALVLQDRRHRQQKMRRRVWVTVALAASVLLLLIAGYAWLPTNPEPVPPRPRLVENPPAPKEPPAPKAPDEPAPPRRPEPRNPLASLTERWVDTTRDHAKVVLVAANLDVVEKLPAMEELPALDAGVREAGQEVSDGVRAVTRNARKAFDFFARELPMPEIEVRKN